MVDKRVSYREMIDEIKTPNTEYMYKQLLTLGKANLIQDIYKSHINGDDRITRSDNMYLLYKDISKSDPDKFSAEVEIFLKDKSLWVATIYMLENYIDSLSRAYKDERNTYEKKEIYELKNKLTSYEDGAINTMERSVIISLNDAERETFYKYAEHRMASE